MKKKHDELFHSVVSVVSAWGMLQDEEDRITPPDGSVYIGDWKAGKQHGKGHRTFPYGSVYEGDWKDGKQHGKAIIFDGDNKARHGEWRDGKRIRWL